MGAKKEKQPPNWYFSRRMYIVFKAPKYTDAEEDLCEHGFAATDSFSCHLTNTALEFVGFTLANTFDWPALENPSKA